VADRSEFYE